MIKKQIFYFFDLVKRDPSYLFLLFLCMFPILPFGIMSASVILYVIVTVVLNYKNFPKRVSSFGLKHYFINTLFYLGVIISILYSLDKRLGLKEIEKGLSIIILPFVIFYFAPILDKKKLKGLAFTFVTTMFFFVVYIYNFFIYKLSSVKKFAFEGKGYLEKLYSVFVTPFSSITNNAINVINEPPIFFFHKAYLSLFLILTIVFVFYYLILKNKLVIYKFIGVILILFFSLVILHWFSIPNLIMLIILIIVFINKLIKKNNNKIYVALVVLVVSIGLYNLPSTQIVIQNNQSIQRNIKGVKVFLNSPFHKKDKKQRSGSRAAINECSIELTKDSFLFGYGVGSVKQQLLDCYSRKNFNVGTLYKLNSHNYYFHLLLTGGILVLLAFLFLLGNNLVISIKNKDFLYCLFLLMLIINLLSENLLFRIHGVLFFSIFNSILYTFNQKNIKF